jgi:hypothetical protein
MCRAGGRQGKNGMIWIVEGMQDVMRCPRMVWFAAEYLLGDRGGLHPDPQGSRIAGCSALRSAAVGQPEERQRMESGRLAVVRVLPMDPLHGGRICPIARRLLARTVECPDRVEIGALARHNVQSVRQPGQHLPSGLHVLRVTPDRVVVGHGLAPIGHGEVWLDRLGGAKLFQRLRIPEGMQRGEAAQEVALPLL